MTNHPALSLGHRSLAIALAVLAAAAVPGLGAQNRPLLTEDPEPIEPGHVVIEAGVEYERGRAFPLSGLEGDLFQVPYLSLSFGLSSLAEFQVDGGFHLLAVDDRGHGPLADDIDFTGDITTDINDPVIATKIRLQRETPRFPALGFRVATRIPSASNESGLGNDSIDWFLTVLAGKTIRSTRVVGNFGLAVLSIPTDGDRQNDLITAAVSVVQPVGVRWDVVGEARTRLDNKGETPIGTEERGEVRFGLRYRLDTVRLDAGVLVGMTNEDADYGVTLGFGYEVPAFAP